MRRIVLASLLTLSACATAPRAPEPEMQKPVTSVPVARENGSLIGLSAAQLMSRLGNPTLQIREGPSLKLQFRNSRCVLDAYLYPEPGAPAGRVEHVDTRAPSGIKASQEVCVALFMDKPN